MRDLEKRSGEPNDRPEAVFFGCSPSSSCAVQWWSDDNGLEVATLAESLRRAESEATEPFQTEPPSRGAGRRGNGTFH